jgi:hypothetical protein
MLPSDSDLETLVRRVIALYNRTHSPNVTAKLITFTSEFITVQFTGSFCYGCGVFEYVDGFAEQLKALSGKFELKPGKTRQDTPRSFEADFSVKAK